MWELHEQAFAEYAAVGVGGVTDALVAAVEVEDYEGYVAERQRFYRQFLGDGYASSAESCAYYADCGVGGSEVVLGGELGCYDIVGCARVECHCAFLSVDPVADVYEHLGGVGTERHCAEGEGVAGVAALVSLVQGRLAECVVEVLLPAQLRYGRRVGASFELVGKAFHRRACLGVVAESGVGCAEERQHRHNIAHTHFLLMVAHKRVDGFRRLFVAVECGGEHGFGEAAYHGRHACAVLFVDVVKAEPLAAVDACSGCGVGCAAVLCKDGCGVEDEQECECVDDFFHKSVVGRCGVQGENLMTELGLTKKLGNLRWIPWPVVPKIVKFYQSLLCRYFTTMTRYLLVDQNSCGLFMRRTYCLLASRCSV